MSKLPAINTIKRTGEECFHLNGDPIDNHLLNFWQWSSSMLLGNSLRGVLAEYIVGSKLDCVSDVRQEWDAYDLVTKGGVKVEVKSAAYLQSWDQENLSSIKFGIKPSYGWDARTNIVSDEWIRASNVYVFCILHHTDKATVDPLNLKQWSFYVISTDLLNELVGEQGSITLSSLLRLNPIHCCYEGISRSIEEALKP